MHSLVFWPQYCQWERDGREAALGTAGSLSPSPQWTFVSTGKDAAYLKFSNDFSITFLYFNSFAGSPIQKCQIPKWFFKKMFSFQRHLSLCLRSEGQRGLRGHCMGRLCLIRDTGWNPEASSKGRKRLAMQQAGHRMVLAGTDIVVLPRDQMGLCKLPVSGWEKLIPRLGCWHLHWHYTSGCKLRALEKLCLIF